MALLPQSYRFENYWGPFDTEDEAIAAVVSNCGECRGTIWLKNGEYWSTEQRWHVLPEGARLVDMLDVIQE